MRARWLGLVVVIAACGDDIPPGAAAVTYYRDVAPILGRHCIGCHREGGLGPFSLTSFAEAHDEAAAISTAAGSRVMPPWPADSSGACNTFVGQRWMSDAEIAVLQAWTGAGAPAGDPRDAVTIAPPADVPFTSSLELASSAPYTVVPGKDEYRCMIVDPQLASDRFITAISVLLDKAEVVHHIQIYAAETPVARSSLAARDARDPAPGFSCDDEGIGDVRYVGVWAAGDLVRRWPDRTGVEVAAGAHLVLQFHYHNHGDNPVVDQSKVALELATTIESPATINSVHGYPLSLPPGDPDATVSKLVSIPVAQESWARAVRIHMHELGTHARMELVRGDHTECVLEIPRWDFGWQLFYTLEHPIALEPGDQIRITCGYDTTSRTTPVSWGFSTEDEMCIGYTYFTL